MYLLQDIEDENKKKHSVSNQKEDEKEIIVSELRELLNSYLNKHKNITINGFCLKNNLSPATISHLRNGITKKYVTPEIARKIVCGMNRGKSIGFVLRNTKGILGEFLRRSFPSLINLEVEGTAPENVEKALSTRNARLVMMLAYNKGGTTRKEIVETLDSFALETLERMLSENALFEDKQGRIKGSDEHIYLNNEITKELIQEVNYFSKPSETTEGQIKILWGKLSKEKRKKQNKIIFEAIEKLRELYKEEDSHGEPSFVTLTSDILKQPKIREEN